MTDTRGRGPEAGAAPGPAPDPAVPRQRRDAQRRRVYLAETPLPSSPLPGLSACANFAALVVATPWWQERFPERALAGLPRLRPGNGARQAFYREETDGPTITLPRRYRTKGVVLHELAHWALGIQSGLPHHGWTFTRVVLDATTEFLGPQRAAELGASFRAHAVHVGRPPRKGPDGRLRYGWDERLRLGRGQTLRVAYVDDDGEQQLVAVFAGFERSGSVARFERPDAPPSRIRSAGIWDVADG